MALYLYPSPSPIDRIYMIKTEKGDYRAYLHAADNTTTEMRKQFVDACYKKRWQTVPMTHLDLPCLEVRGFGSPEELQEFLTEKKLLAGKAKKLLTPGDTSSLSEMIQQRTLQASGISYLVGDYGFFIYGLKGKNLIDSAAGIAYAAGTLALALFGRASHAQLDVEDLAQQMVSHLQENKHSIPNDLSLTRIAEDRPKPLLEHASNFMSTYPSEMFCAVTGVAGALVAVAAHGKYKLSPKGHGLEHLLDIGLGTTTMASCAVGGLVKEKHRDPDEPLPEGTMEKIWEWVREKPLRLTGYGLMVSTMCHAVSTGLVIKDGRKLPIGSLERAEKMGPIAGRAQFVICNLVAEILMSISSKGHGEGVETDSSVETSIVGIAAELIASKPAEYREQMIKSVTKFLGDPSMLGSKNVNIEQELRTAVQTALDNPWAKDFQPQLQLPITEANGGTMLAAKDTPTRALQDLSTHPAPLNIAKMPAYVQQRLATLPAAEQHHKPS